MQDKHDDSTSKALSDPEPIPEHEPEDAPQTEDRDAPHMSAESALVVCDRLEEECLEDVSAPFSDEALEAAAVCRDQDPGKFQSLRAAIKASNIDTNDWKGAVKDRLRDLKSRERRQGDHRPSIADQADLHIMVDRACEALSEMGGLYERGGELVEIRRTEDGTEMRPVPRSRVRDLLSRAARFERRTQDGMQPIKPPKSVAESVHARGEWGLSPLKGFVDGAAFLENGDILSTGGYHPEHRLYVRRSADLDVGRSPTQAEAEKARERLFGLVEDFEFREEREAAYRSAWLGATLTILARPAIGGGCTPLFLFDANRPRVGKTRLAEIGVSIPTGQDPSPQPVPTGRGADNEMRKTITGIARSGNPVVFFDNVKGKLGGASLELAITARRWSARILHQSTQFEGPLEVTWIATSNNATLTPDMRGRTIPIKLHTDLEAPEERAGFKHPHIKDHVFEHRAEYLSDAMTILRAWHVAGRPDYGLTPWGSFEAWGQIVRNAIVFSGGVDPCQARESLEGSDPKTLALRAVLEAWPDGKTYTASDLSKGMKEGRMPGGSISDQNTELPDALNELLPSSKPISIGRNLGYRKEQVEDGRKLVHSVSGNRRVWKVVDVNS